MLTRETLRAEAWLAAIQVKGTWGGKRACGFEALDQDGWVSYPHSITKK